MQGQVTFGRVSSGVMLFVIFAGKLLYDVVFFPHQHRDNSSAGKDIISMIAIVVGISMMAMLLVFLVALYIIKSMNGKVGLS